MYAVRAEVYLTKREFEKAVEDANKALEIKPDVLAVILTRARANLALKNLEKAKEDIEVVEQAEPNAAAVTLGLKLDIAIQEKKYAEAIQMMEPIVQQNPENPELLLQLGMLYHSDNRSKRALRIADRLIKAKPDEWQAYRFRGDVLLAQGKHADAIRDYQTAIENISKDDEDINDDYSGILNNLSWVMATSPEDSIRDAKLSLEYGLKACELTKFEKPHILSTLAAAYAENGQFDKAIEWSKKAVELGRIQKHEQIDQLELELKSYEENKPWREKQENADKPAKAASDSGIDT
jgi:tetratricopeptide (TPR) repeat protein